MNLIFYVNFKFQNKSQIDSIILQMRNGIIFKFMQTENQLQGLENLLRKFKSDIESKRDQVGRVLSF